MRPADKLCIGDTVIRGIIEEELPAPSPWLSMSLEELRAAIKKAREVRAYVPVNVFYIEVVVQKSKVLAALDARIKEWTELGNKWSSAFDAEWLEEGVLLVGGQFYDD